MVQCRIRIHVLSPLPFAHPVNFNPQGTSQLVSPALSGHSPREPSNPDLQCIHYRQGDQILENCVGQQVPLMPRGTTDGPSTLPRISVGSSGALCPAPSRESYRGLEALQSAPLSSLQGDTIVGCWAPLLPSPAEASLALAPHPAPHLTSV